MSLPPIPTHSLPLSTSSTLQPDARWYGWWKQAGEAVRTLQSGGGGGSGSVTTVSVASANGLAGTVADPTTTPVITLRTTVTGLLKGDGTIISAAAAGTDYQEPISLTTTGTSGAATLVGNTLNVPQYGAPVTPAALTRTNDTNVTLTLGGTPATALLQATSVTVGWAGTLAVARGGTGGGTASGTLLDNITGFSSTGHLVRTAAGTYAFRTVTGTANEIDVTNGSGVSGNPTLSLPTLLTLTGKTITGGIFQTLVSLAIGTATLMGYKFRLIGGNADQMVLDNTGQQYTELDYANNGVLKALTFWDNSNNAFVFRTLGTVARIRFDTNAVDRVFFEPNGSVVIGNAIGATTATDGFLYIQACAGAPTGVPTSYTGRVPMRYDSTNNNLYVYNGGWKKTATFT